jgi:hypothetical protein
MDIDPPEYAAATTPANSILEGFNQKRKQAFIEELIQWQGDVLPSFDEFLVSKLTRDSERLMAMSFKLWKSNESEQFPIVVNDDVLKMLGYTLKGNFKRDLLKEFGDGDGNDWIFIKSAENTPRTEHNGGRPSETIKISAEVFKTMAMKSNTLVGKKTRAYFVALESVFFGYTEASRIWENRRLSNEIESKDNAIESYKRQLEESRVPFSNKEAAQTVYVCSDPNSEAKNLYKIGLTQNITDKRMKQLQTGNPGTLTVIMELKCINARILESTTQSILKQLNCHSNGEWYQAPIEKIRGIILALNYTLNTVLRVENATEEEIMKAVFEKWTPHVNQEVKAKDDENYIDKFVHDIYKETKQSNVGIKSNDAATDYIKWANDNGLPAKFTNKDKMLLDVAFKGQTLDRKRRRFRTSDGQVSGWSGWVKKVITSNVNHNPRS